jgi:hypothetical protein
MRFFSAHLVMSAWLLLSAFVLGHTPGAGALAGLAAVLIGTFSFAAISWPPIRFANAPVAFFLACVALFSTGSSPIARLSDAFLAAVIFAFSMVPGRAWGSIPQPRI